MPEDILDIAIEYTFPASDPISVVSAYRLREREARARDANGGKRQQ